MEVLNQYYVTQYTATTLFYTNAHWQSQLEGKAHNYLLWFSYRTVTTNLVQ